PPPPPPASLGRQFARSRERERPQTPPADLRGRTLDAAAQNGGHRVGKLVARGAGIEQGGQEHVARGAADDVDVEDVHRGDDCRAIIAAIVPAPTPSSTFTQATPGAHDVSIDRSAPRPPSEAP